MGSIFLIAGSLCFLYYLAVVIYSGLNTSFAWFWLLAGLAFCLGAGVCTVPSLQRAFFGIPRIIRLGAGVLTAAGLLVFVLAQACIISGMAGGTQEHLDYLIVLGAQVRGTRVSRALAQRLDCAAVYLKEHEDTLVIVSGGQGPGEDISEAQAMAEYLERAGIAPERIRKEGRSVNTAQNIRFSMELMEKEDPKVGIVSNDFHVFRAVHIAKAQGVKAEGIPAPSTPGMYPHYMTREAVALVKDLVFGNLVL